MMRRLTHLGGARFTIGLPLAIVALGQGERTLGLAMLAANAVSHLAVQVLKRLVQRARPCDAVGHTLALIDIPDPFSFPSGHAAAATALAVTASVAHPWLAPLALPLGGLVVTSRVMLRVHHVSDVLAGAALGAAGAIVAALTFL
jgi:undecaprenyl-diphosphatase